MIKRETEGEWVNREESTRIAEKIVRYCSSSGKVNVTIKSWWQGELRWARNRVSSAADRRNLTVTIQRDIDGSVANAETNQTDEESLRSLVRVAERRVLEQNPGQIIPFNNLEEPILPLPDVQIWSDATSGATARTRSSLANRLINGSERSKMIAAGYMEMRVGTRAVLDMDVSGDNKGPKRLESSLADKVFYDEWTHAQCSMTVRHPAGVGSGWAGRSAFGWNLIDAAELADRALDKCLASINPVRIEPGRYTVILEPDAFCELVEPLMGVAPMQRQAAETIRDVGSPFWLSGDEPLQIGRSRLGLKVLDERITISHDPIHPLLGVIPEPGLHSVTWIRNGVLESLQTGHEYARIELDQLVGTPFRPSFRINGGSSTTESMIAGTERGLLVSRLFGVSNTDRKTLLCTGLTRDGLWLIENGKITQAVNNMRFLESPLHAMNQVLDIGQESPVFRPVRNPAGIGVTPAIVPSIKVADFSFTSSIDSI